MHLTQDREVEAQWHIEDHDGKVGFYILLLFYTVGTLLFVLVAE